MNARLTIFTALLGSLIVILSQMVTGYTLEDTFGVNMANVTLIEKHGPLATVLAAIAGLAVIFLVTAAARTLDETAPAARGLDANHPADHAPEGTHTVARAVGIVVAGMGLAIILVFLLVDLPDIGDTGMYNAPGAGNLDATGSSAAGLWLELIGGLILLMGGVAIATLNRDHLRTIGPQRNDDPRGENRPERDDDPRPQSRPERDNDRKGDADTERESDSQRIKDDLKP